MATMNEGMSQMDRLHYEFVAEQKRKQPHLTAENLFRTLNVRGIENLPTLDCEGVELSVSDLISWAHSQLKDKQ